MKLTYQIYRFTLKETFSISYGNYAFRDALIVTLFANGKSGYGECTGIDYYGINLHSFEEKLAAIRSKIESQTIKHPFEVYVFLKNLELPHFLCAALDCAYWDLYGKLEKKSFLDINKIKIKSIPESSITISVASCDDQIKKIEQSHWAKFKVKCKGFNEENIVRLSKLEQVIALDSNASFTIAECRKLEEMPLSKRFLYLEQPMAVGIENYSNLRLNSNANWMADEDLQDISQLKLLKNHYESVNIKLVKCGGLTPALELIQAAKEMGFKTMIGCMTESTIGISAGAMLAPFADYVDLDGANLIKNDIANGTKIVNGTIEFSDKFGLGIEII